MRPAAPTSLATGHPNTSSLGDAQRRTRWGHAIGLLLLTAWLAGCGAGSPPDRADSSAVQASAVPAGTLASQLPADAPPDLLAAQDVAMSMPGTAGSMTASPLPSSVANAPALLVTAGSGAAPGGTAASMPAPTGITAVATTAGPSFATATTAPTNTVPTTTALNTAAATTTVSATTGQTTPVITAPTTGTTLSTVVPAPTAVGASAPTSTSTSTSTSNAAPAPSAPGITYACAAGASQVIPKIATKAAWDALYDAQWGDNMPTPYGGSLDFAWAGHYWVRAFTSMARTHGDTKYLDRAVRMIDYWLAHTDGPQGWNLSNPAQMMLDTGMISHAISIFSYVAWSDSRFAAYRSKAATYINRIETYLHTYDYQWVENAPYPGSPSVWRYASCTQGLCRVDQILMYNQAATVAKAMLLIDRTRRLMGQTPDAGLLYKADKVAAYFKTFADGSSGAYRWKYSGAVAVPDRVEDIDHGHIDVGYLISAYRFGIGGLSAADMSKLAGTFRKVLNGAAGPGDVSTNVDGTGVPDQTWRRLPSGYDWIDLVEFDATLLDPVISVWNKWMYAPTSARYYLGWAEIQRVRACKPQL